MTDNEIRTLALVNGFSLRQQPDGTEDINPYVFAFARQLLAMENARCAAAEKLGRHRALHEAANMLAELLRSNS